MPYPEFAELAAVCQLPFFDIRDQCATRSNMTPGDQALQLLPLAFRDQLDGAVMGVAHPAGEAEAPRFVQRRVAEADALDAAADAQPHACWLIGKLTH